MVKSVAVAQPLAGVGMTIDRAWWDQFVINLSAQHILCTVEALLFVKR